MYSSKTWGNHRDKQYLEHVTKTVLVIVRTILWRGVRSCGSEDIFVNDFFQLIFSSLPFFLTWHCCTIILIFSKNFILHFYFAIPLNIELKINICKTYIRSVYIIFPRWCERASKLVLLNKTYWTITCSESVKNTLKKRCEISSSLTIKTISLT